ncbi:hypothetical protein CC1G_04123 [Coprinopsis cinerea okayama7|uniref:Uncharacterized protein n=1 Tax=Coprinopsis cinerea (strain Okayama-7 / 130 / ATCC MYA-4618 / FGSC 9003) TaxID=240176 RepID=A8NW25_COPC7|nr:hypothetical protein CC1G_04123 [Coprinopsis cinerea okayama7\|eukprot:XP_001836810.2 hypothetical protein CC1G_04123 [Coprinopsis cinerea okayama7\
MDVYCILTLQYTRGHMLYYELYNLTTVDASLGIPYEVEKRETEMEFREKAMATRNEMLSLDIGYNVETDCLVLLRLYHGAEHTCGCGLFSSVPGQAVCVVIRHRMLLLGIEGGVWPWGGEPNVVGTRVLVFRHGSLKTLYPEELSILRTIGYTSNSLVFAGKPSTSQLIVASEDVDALDRDWHGRFTEMTSSQG